jgi:hypothetical protein
MATSGPYTGAGTAVCGDGQATNGTCRRQTGAKSMFAGLQAVKAK